MVGVGLVAFIFFGYITWSDGEAVVAEADVEELGLLSQFVVAYHVKNLDAPSGWGADEEFVSFGCEFDALASALGVESVEKSRRIGGNVEYNDAVVVGPQCSGHGHFAVGVRGKALGTIGHLLDDSVDDGFFQRQICKENVGVINAVSGRTLANQCLFPSGLIRRMKEVSKSLVGTPEATLTSLKCSMRLP